MKTLPNTRFVKQTLKPCLLGVLASLIFFGFTAVSSGQSASPDTQLKGTLLDPSGAGVG